MHYEAALEKQIFTTDKLAAVKKAAADARPIFEKVKATEKPAPVTKPMDDPLDPDEAPETAPATNAPAPKVQAPTPTEDTEEDTSETGDDE